MSARPDPARALSIEDIQPLAPAQEGILFESLYAPESGAYVEQAVYDLEGVLDLCAFEAAWRKTVERHSILRTAFVGDGLEEPVQVVSRHVPLEVVREDWSALDEDAARAKLDAFLAADRSRGFDPARAPLLRLALVRLGERRHLFVWTFHHLLLDGWSAALLLREVLAWYEALTLGRPLELERPRPYRDYVSWVRRQDPEAARTFWQRALDGIAPPARLPLERPESGEPGGDGDERATLSIESSEALCALARRRHVTLSTILHATWAILLARHTGEREALFGTVVSGRPAAIEGIDSMVGLFINTLPVRLRVSADEPAARFLERVHSQFLELRQFEHHSLAEALRFAGVARGASLIESLLVFENYPVAAVPDSIGGGLKARSAHSFQRTSFPLTAWATPGPRLEIGLSFQRRRFAARSVRRLLEHWRELLEQWPRGIGRPLRAISCVGKAESHRLLVEWNDTRVERDEGRCLHDRFEAAAARSPDALALVCAGESLSYGELASRVHRLARHLRSLGVGPEVHVGLLLERGVEAIVSLLAVLEAGGAYVPLDPSHPRERLAFVCRDASLSLVLTRSSLASRLPAREAALVLLDTLDLSSLPAEPLEALARPAHLAYIIYTSGSTGRPKGVLVEHRGVVNVIEVSIERLGLSPASRLLQAASLGFDASVLEIFSALGAGATLVVADRTTLASPALLSRLLREERITSMAMPPTLLETIPEGDYPDLSSIIVGGESCPASAVARFAAGRRFFNVYAPTEGTIYATLMPCSPARPEPPPIGRPIANMRAYVLDSHLEPLPTGVVGELCLGGIGVTRGYLHRPALTAERFVPDPFCGAAGARLYRTGDLARLRDDETLEFVGRADRQLKIRGVRIEPGEIESVLSEHPAVAEAVVEAFEDRLVGYVVAREGARPESASLRRFLAERLPPALLPSHFVVLEAMPLDRNGKIDRRALPAPTSANASEAFAPPRTPIEQIVAAVFAEVLTVERVGANDDFFERGGHSLLATQVVSRVREALGVELALRALFDSPTVAGLSASVEAALAARRSPPLPPITRTLPDGDRPLSFAQERLWFLEELDPGTTTYVIPVALRLRGTLDRLALERSLREIVRRHEALRTTFAVVEGRPVQRVTGKAEDFALSVTEGIGEADLRRLVGAELCRPFDLERGPLLRASLLALGESDHALVLVFHHIVADGWSMGVLARELSALYEAFHHEKPSPLAELSIQYPDLAVWQRQVLEGERLEQAIAHFTKRLEGAPAALELPTDRPRPRRRSGRGAAVAVHVPRDLTQALSRLARREGASLYMALLAAFQGLLSRLCGQEDVVVGVPIANRNRVETEPLVGFFVNTLVVRGELSGDPSFRKLLGRVREEMLEAYAHQDVPFERLVQALEPKRDLSRTPLFQVMFDLQNAPLEAPRLDGLEVEPIEIESDTAKFDWTLTLVEAEDGLRGGLEYATDLFDRKTLERAMRRFERLLCGIVEDPDRPLSQVTLLEEEERLLLAQWAEGEKRPEEPRPVTSVLTWIEEQAISRPEALAVRLGDRSLTYGDVDRRANQLAHRLRALGVGTETRVALCLERSVELVVAIVGTLKAGAAYVPLDPSYPSERLRYVLDDSRAKVVVTHDGDSLDLGQSERAQVSLDSSWREIESERTDRPNVTIAPEQAAYVIYTSGSTGRPKGWSSSTASFSTRRSHDSPSTRSRRPAFSSFPRSRSTARSRGSSGRCQAAARSCSSAREISAIRRASPRSSPATA
jgi:amino acid adenylation domain-containing protein